MQTIHLLVASLLITGAALAMFSYALNTMMNLSVPTPTPEVTLTLDLYCGTVPARDQSSGFWRDQVVSLSVRANVAARNHYKESVTLTRVALLAGDQKYEVPLNLALPPREHGRASTQELQLAKGSPASARVHPGDELQLSGGTLVKTRQGLVVEYKGTHSNTPVPTSYNSPFQGYVHYTLETSGAHMWASIRQPGYAANTITGRYGYDRALVLAEFKATDYETNYEDRSPGIIKLLMRSEIPYYFDFYRGGRHTGFYMRASGEMGIIGERDEINAPVWSKHYVGFWASRDRVELYLDDSKRPGVSGSGVSNLAEYGVAYGVARERNNRNGTHIGSEVYYQGVFRDRVITVRGLAPGYTVVLSTPLSSVTLTASSSTLAVDVLEFFSPRELVEALKEGGIRLEVNTPHQQALFGFLVPDRAFVHVSGRTIDTWVEVRVMHTPKCTVGAGFTKPGKVVIENLGGAYRVTALLNNGDVSLGVYPKVTLDASSYKITVYYNDGSKTVIEPVKKSALGAVFGFKVNVLLVDDKVAILERNQVTKDTKSFTKIEVEGTMTLKLHLTS